MPAAERGWWRSRVCEMNPPVLHAGLKGFPTHGAPLALSAVAQQGWQLLRGDLPFPLAVLRRQALVHNLSWMRQFCDQRGISLAPHGKTTMSPQLYQLQLSAGAWAISFATVYQAGIGVAHGVRRVLIANQVLQAADLDGLAHLLATTPGLEAMFLVDSIAQIEQIEHWRASRSSAIVFAVLLELGLAGQRTGCRTHEQAMAVAQRIHASPALRLVGIETYEGGLATCEHAHDTQAVLDLMARLQAVAQACDARDWFDAEEVLITAGGSALFDVVARDLRPRLSRPARGVLRSGCYLTHDHVQYRQLLRCVAERLQLTQTLEPALEVLSVVQSCAEPGLAHLSMGKRDVSYDRDLPVPLWRAQVGDMQTQAVPSHWQVVALNDQHAHLRYDAQRPAHEHPQVGEIVGSGISHPCTTFDKWRWMPVVDDDYRVVEAITIHC
jgi:D-serine dehydratase